MRVLTPKVNVHVVDKGTTHPEELENDLLKRITFLRAEVPTNLTKMLQLSISMNLFINLDVLIELLVQQSNLYLQQNRRNFLTNAKEMKTFMAVNELPTIPMYWDCDHFVGKVGIQNIFMETRY